MQQRSRQHNSPCPSLFSSEGCWSCWRRLSLAITLPMAESRAEVPRGDAPVAPERGERERIGCEKQGLENGGWWVGIAMPATGLLQEPGPAVGAGRPTAVGSGGCGACVWAGAARRRLLCFLAGLKPKHPQQQR